MLRSLVGSEMCIRDRNAIDYIEAGDIGAAVGFKDIKTGDTLSAEKSPIILESMIFPDPVIGVAVEPKTKADIDRLGMSLAKLAEEDPTFQVKTDEASGQTIISGMGELHLDIIVDRLKREFKVEVNQGKDEQECLQVAYCIAESPLVKTALFASDPNWGRILAAVGRAGLENLDIDSVKIYLGETQIVDAGARAPGYREELGQLEMNQEEIAIRIDLARGSHNERVWTSDLSHDYVRINAEYRT